MKRQLFLSLSLLLICGCATCPTAKCPPRSSATTHNCPALKCPPKRCDLCPSKNNQGSPSTLAKKHYCPTLKCPPKRCNLCPTKKQCQDACFAFYRMDNPLGDKSACPQQKITYARLGYQCADKKGMVPISPRFGLPAIDCPWIRSTGDLTEQTCPSLCAGTKQPIVTEAPIEQGFLLTAFDTPRGTRYVMIEAERDFSPQTRLVDVEKDFAGLTETLNNISGKAVIYLTNYPLITPKIGESSRSLRELEINGLKNAISKEKQNELSIVNWQ